MENSTKALLIAASVLIAIVLISVGIKILSSTSGVSNQVDKVSDSMGKSVFNSQFSSYFDSSASGTQAKNLVSTVISSNSTSEHKVFINLYPKVGSNILHKNDATGLQNIFNTISNNSKYNITVSPGCSVYSGGYDNGFIACVSIREK